MSFMNKVKNFFYEDVEDDEEVVVKEKPKKETKIDFKSLLKRHEKFDDEEELDIPEIKEKKNEDLSERELFKAERTFNFPMDLGDEIFDEEKEVTIIKEEKKPIERVPEPVRPVQRTNSNTSSIYRNISKEEPKKEEETKHFRPSPVISPVYGILDKNYTVDDVVEKDLNKTKEFSIEKKSVDFDTVRNRAYKELDEEIEKTLTGDIFYNLDNEEVKDEEVTDDFDDDNDSVIITYNDEDINEETSDIPLNEKEDVSSIQEEPITESESNIDESNEEDDLVPDVKIEPKEEVKKVTKRSKKKEEPEIEEEKEDLFNLIDNMYTDEDDEEDE